MAVCVCPRLNGSVTGRPASLDIGPDRGPVGLTRLGASTSVSIHQSLFLLFVFARFLSLFLTAVCTDFRHGERRIPFLASDGDLYFFWFTVSFVRPSQCD